jgi:hypothetical protein
LDQGRAKHALLRGVDRTREEKFWDLRVGIESQGHGNCHLAFEGGWLSYGHLTWLVFNAWIIGPMYGIHRKADLGFL